MWARERFGCSTAIGKIERDGTLKVAIDCASADIYLTNAKTVIFNLLEYFFFYLSYLITFSKISQMKAIRRMATQLVAPIVRGSKIPSSFYSGLFFFEIVALRCSFTRNKISPQSKKHHPRHF